QNVSWRYELNTVFPAALRALVALPDHDGGIAGVHGQVGERDAMIEMEVVFENDHAAVRIDDAGVGFNLDALALLRIPLQTHGHTRIHAMAAALLFVARAEMLRLFLRNRGL